MLTRCNGPRQADVLVLRGGRTERGTDERPLSVRWCMPQERNVESAYVAGRPVNRAGRFVDIEARSAIERANPSHDHLMGAANAADEDLCPSLGRSQPTK